MTIVPVYVAYTPATNSRRRTNDLIYKKEEYSDADVLEGKISEKAPLAKAILGKCSGEEFSYSVQGSLKNHIYKAKILSIKKYIKKRISCPLFCYLISLSFLE